MSPETGSLLLLLLFCAGATAVNILTTADPTEDKEALGARFPPEKPGTCPADVNLLVVGSTLLNECKRDRDCKGKNKCCFSGGRRRCLLPLDVKQNACPYFVDSTCIMDFVPLCQSDDQCQGTERCCYYKCSLQCMPTVKVKPGSCPIPRTRCAFPQPPPKCESDSDCQGKKKCCTPKCQQVCTDPDPRSEEV
ncbi:uncharacterized protein LOC143989245 [Lithobates pipiens]